MKLICNRFRGKLTTDNPLIYSKLRDMGFTKKVSRLFTCTPVCRYDSTKNKDGPHTHRVFQVDSSNQLKENGWTFQKRKPFFLISAKYFLRKKPVADLNVDPNANALYREDLIDKDSLNDVYKKFQYYREPKTNRLLDNGKLSVDMVPVTLQSRYAKSGTKPLTNMIMQLSLS